MSERERTVAGRIVVAEDSLVMRAVVRRHLEDHGYSVVEAEDGLSALAACRRVQPDAALLDIEMPGLDGHGALMAMKADPDLADIPVVFLTGRTTTEDVVAGLRLGAHDYLKKPFEPAELLARVSSAVATKRLQDELRRRNAELDLMSCTDALTGLSNRRHAQARLDELDADAAGGDRSLTVVMFDIDHFKVVNDTFGHGGGDAVLVDFADRLRSVLEVGELAARWGGEEFLVILPGAGAARGLQVAERAVAAVAAAPFAVPAGRTCAITVSAGCATGTEVAPDELVSRADGALYAAKDAGRARVMVAS